MNATDITTLARQVLTTIAPEANLADVGEDEDLREALDLDSMDFLNFVIGMSRGSGVSIAERDYPKLFTLRGIKAFLSG